MSTADPLLARIAALEARLAHLEGRLDDELPEIPWHVITAAVAAAVPNARIIGVQRLPDSLPYTPMNFWNMGGRFDHFKSHAIR